MWKCGRTYSVSTFVFCVEFCDFLWWTTLWWVHLEVDFQQIFRSKVICDFLYSAPARRTRFVTMVNIPAQPSVIVLYQPSFHTSPTIRSSKQDREYPQKTWPQKWSATGLWNTSVQISGIRKRSVIEDSGAYDTWLGRLKGRTWSPGSLVRVARLPSLLILAVLGGLRLTFDWGPLTSPGPSLCLKQGTGTKCESISRRSIRTSLPSP